MARISLPPKTKTVTIQMGKRNLSKLILRPAIFFDRDGVLTVPQVLDGKGFAPRSLQNFQFYDDAKESLLRTRSAGFINVVVSNQPDLATGLLLESTLEEMNSKMIEALAVDEVYICPHLSKDNCRCRKPRPGMIESAARELSIDLSSSWMIGDRDSDIEAGSRAGLKTVFIDRNWLNEFGGESNFQSTSLKGAVDIVLLQGQH